MRQRTSLGSSIQSHYITIYVVLWFLNIIVAKMKKKYVWQIKKHKSIVLYNAIWLKMNHMQSQLSLKSLFVKKISQGNFISDHNKYKLKNDTSNNESAFANTCYNTCNYDTQISVWFLILFTRILDFIEIKCLQVLNERLYTKRCLFLPYSKVSFDKGIIFL